MLGGTLRILLAYCVVALAGFAAASAFAAEPARVALLIGNRAYVGAVGELKNPDKDIETVGAALEKLGFAVKKLTDARKEEMETAIRRYADQVRKAGNGAISFFYYSGHGVVNPDTNVNYLIPVDVADPNSEDVWYRSIEQRLVIDLLSEHAKNATHFVVFDACRSELSIAGKALGADKGFVPLADVHGMLIAYSTAAKKTASDSGQFAKILAESLQLKMPATHAFLEMQSRVVKAMKQEPWLSLSYVPTVYLAGEEAAPPADAEGVAAREWLAVDKNSPAMLTTFLARHGESSYAPYAKVRLGELSRTVVVVPLPGEACKDGLLVSVAVGKKPCIKPGSGEFFKDCPDCPEMVIAPAGSFTMGLAPAEAEALAKEFGKDGEQEAKWETRQHKVTISEPFAAGRFAVTFSEWDACVADGGCGGYRPADRGWGRDDRPVINVSWYDAKAYVQWLSDKTGKSYRLLSEAEREYVTRAGTNTPFWWGSSISVSQANYNGDYTYAGSAKGEYRQKTLPVKSFQPNPWGLYQVHGNVWEWVEDCWEDSYNGTPDDGSVRTTGDCASRVPRGGSWLNHPRDLRAARRLRLDTGYRLYNVGFRVARDLLVPVAK
jgi:formylglycine-generating enzyme required for sulfatase activity